MRLLAWDFEKPKLLIFPFLVRTNNEGVSELFCLAGDAGLPETVRRARLDFRPIGISPEQSGPHSRNATFLARVL